MAQLPLPLTPGVPLRTCKRQSGFPQKGESNSKRGMAPALKKAIIGNDWHYIQYPGFGVDSNDRGNTLRRDFIEENSEEMGCQSPPVLTRAQLTRHVRRHADREFYDESGELPVGTAIYALADPRDIRSVRYIGQTQNPRRRLLQHIAAAQLWLPDNRPWFCKAPKLRPLYDWVREMYRDEMRLPTMVVSAWVATTAAARIAERARIYECLSRRMPLLNVEMEIRGEQWPLI
jgi:hypothetical protein